MGHLSNADSAPDGAWWDSPTDAAFPPLRMRRTHSTVKPAKPYGGIGVPPLHLLERSGHIKGLGDRLLEEL